MTYTKAAAVADAAETAGVDAYTAMIFGSAFTGAPWGYHVWLPLAGPFPGGHNFASADYLGMYSGARAVRNAPV